MRMPLPGVGACQEYYSNNSDNDVVPFAVSNCVPTVTRVTAVVVLAAINFPIPQICMAPTSSLTVVNNTGLGLIMGPLAF